MSQPEPQRQWTPLELLKTSTRYLEEKKIEAPRLNAEWMLAQALGWTRIRLYTHHDMPIEPAEVNAFRAMIKRRVVDREPLQYILGHTEFLELKLKVTPAVLIPRPETEALAEWAIGMLEKRAEPMLQVLDLGTGSGCLALAIAQRLPQSKIVATDLSAEALDVARHNCEALGLGERVLFLHGDLFSALNALEPERRRFDLIVSNPPYIAPSLRESLQPEVVRHEPAMALFAEKSGLAVLERVVEEAVHYLNPRGALGLELSPEQAGTLTEKLQQQPQWSEISIGKDFQQKDRFLLAIRNGSES